MKFLLMGWQFPPLVTWLLVAATLYAVSMVFRDDIRNATPARRWIGAALILLALAGARMAADQPVLLPCSEPHLTNVCGDDPWCRLAQGCWPWP